MEDLESEDNFLTGPVAAAGNMPHLGTVDELLQVI